MGIKGLRSHQLPLLAGNATLRFGTAHQHNAQQGGKQSQFSLCHPCQQSTFFLQYSVQEFQTDDMWFVTISILQICEKCITVHSPREAVKIQMLTCIYLLQYSFANRRMLRSRGYFPASPLYGLRAKTWKCFSDVEKIKMLLNP